MQQSAEAIFPGFTGFELGAGRVDLAGDEQGLPLMEEHVRARATHVLVGRRRRKRDRRPERATDEASDQVLHGSSSQPPAEALWVPGVVPRFGVALERRNARPLAERGTRGCQFGRWRYDHDARVR